LVILGDGEDRQAVESAADGKHIEIRGAASRREVLGEMRRSIGLVVPSVVSENFPMVYAEAAAAGLPVLAWSSNVVADLVARHGSGLTTSWDEDVRIALHRAEPLFRGRRSAVREVFEREMSERAYLTRATSLYGELVGGTVRAVDE
jgi:glycosyltransferase involved in cell wall biosynthesis